MAAGGVGCADIDDRIGAAALGRGGNVDGRTGGCPGDGVAGCAAPCIPLRGASGGTNGRGAFVDGAGRPTPKTWAAGLTSGTSGAACVLGDAGVFTTRSLTPGDATAGDGFASNDVAVVGACVGPVTR